MGRFKFKWGRIIRNRNGTRPETAGRRVGAPGNVSSSAFAGITKFSDLFESWWTAPIKDLASAHGAQCLVPGSQTIKFQVYHNKHAIPSWSAGYRYYRTNEPRPLIHQWIFPIPGCRNSMHSYLARGRPRSLSTGLFPAAVLSRNCSSARN